MKAPLGNPANRFITLLMVAALAACGSDNKKSPYTPEPQPQTPKPQTQPISSRTTTVGGTFVGAGRVAVLVAQNDGTLSTQTQDRTGRTLYVFANDPVDSSTCTSTTCLTNWPPLLAEDGTTATAPFSVIERDDGHSQWAVNGKALYFFHGDAAPGAVNGEGVGGVWHAARFEPALTKTAADSERGALWSARGEVLVTQGPSPTFTPQLQDKNGFSLYTFAMDAPGVSNCSGPCLANWPALLAHPADQAEPPFSIITRTLDAAGTTARQWAYQGRPLYFFSGDSQPGDTNGAGLPNWQLARPLPWRITTTGHGSAFAAAGVTQVTSVDEAGTVTIKPATKHGFALYTSDKDEPGIANCVGECLKKWPALIADAGAVPRGPFTLVERDGVHQWALNGEPLYFFSGDAAAGDINGDGVAGNFHLARIPPVAVLDNAEEGAVFVAKKTLLDAQGQVDNSRVGFTLFTFSQDPQGSSTCFNACASNWPPLFAPANANAFGDFSVISRDDPASTADDAAPAKQWAYRGKPLYFSSADTQPGQLERESGNWYLARP